MQQRITRAAQTICQAKETLALTGAGISVESGIPDFRSPGGLWERFDPLEYGTIEAFRADPEKVWQMLKEVSSLLNKARPNPAHLGLGRLQEMGLLKAIITQNIDNLHQAGGASRVIEYHGNARTLSCLSCKQQCNASEMEGQGPPTCHCGGILKPEVVFFGEPIPLAALQEAHELAAGCDTLLILGTSGEVAPANTIPLAAKKGGATVIEINLQPTVLTNYLTDLFLQGKAGKVVSQLVQEVERIVL
jgi:NAD-dependent deacetylase